jgi:hypothetical protein
VNLPEDVIKLSLWSTLHDGDLTAIVSDLMARTLTLHFDVGYVKEFHSLPEETRFVIIVSGVQSVRSANGVPWPGGCSIPPQTPYEQQQAIVSDYQRKWREESLSWSAFERLIDDGLEVSSAILSQGSEGVALRLGVMAGDNSYVDTFIRGEEITFLAGERQLTPQEFVDLGEAYWESFAKGRKPR